MSEPADIGLLGRGHALMAQWIVDLLEGKIKDSEGVALRPTAAELSVMRAFLKDNSITCPPAKGNAMEALREKLEQKRRNRVHVAPFNPETDIGDGAHGKMQ